MDFRDAKGPVVNPSGNVEQHFGDIYYNINNIQKPDDIPLLPFIPEPPLDFTGRNEELNELLAEYAADKNIIGLRGIGGVGKTALALKLAQSLKDRYPDGQILVDMMGTTNPISPMEAMTYVIRSYHRNEKIPESDSDVKDRYLEVLNGKRILLLLDNALDDKQVIKLIPPMSCALLITSRLTIKIPGLFKKDLDVMKPGEALELLLNVCCPGEQDKSRRADPAWPEIASLCGFLPLALRAAASYLANSEDVSPKQYAQELKDERTRLETIGEQGVEMSVDASFGLSFQRLMPAAQKTFLDLSVFPADFDAQAEEKICQDDGHRNLSELVRWSLVEFSRESPEYGRYRVHDLARIFSSARQTDESKAIIAEKHSSYYRDVLSFATELYKNGNTLAGLNAFDLERTNIESAWAWAKENLAKSNAAASICSSFLNAPYLLELRQHPKERISWLETALAASRRLNDPSMEGVHLGNLGIAYAALGDSRKAIEYYEHALAIAKEIEDKRNEGAWLGNLGNAYRALGDARKAIEYYKQALAIAKEIGDKRNEGASLGNLGNAFADFGDAHKAIEYYKQALLIDLEIGDRGGEANALGNLGNAYCALGDVHKAIEYCEQHLVIVREIGDKRNEGASLGNLGLAYADLGDARKAIEYYEQHLVIAHEIGDRRGEGNALGNLGRAYADLGDARKAIEYYDQAQAIAREIGDRRGEGNALFNSSLALYKLGKHPEAIKSAEMALEIYKQIESPVATRVEQQLAEWRK